MLTDTGDALIAGATVPIELEQRGLIHREPGTARSLGLLAAPEELPILR